MTRNITIPREAVEAAARAYVEAMLSVPQEDPIATAIRAGIAAWPGVHERTSGHYPNGVTGHGATIERRLILPLPTENANAEG